MLRIKFKSLYVSIIFVCIYSNVIAQGIPKSILKKHLDNDEEFSWSSRNYPGPYPGDASEDLLVTVDRGYFLTIVLESLDIDGLEGHLLAMKPGTSLEGEGKGKVFTFTIKPDSKFAIHTDSVYFSFRVPNGKNDRQRKGFKLRIKRVGEIVTSTTAIPTTVVTWPSPSGSESIYHTGFIHGKNEKEFINPETLANLKVALSNMATKYCKTNNIATTEPISQQNVIISYLLECPSTWPDSKLCVKIRFAIPILLPENSASKEYQLNAVSLNLTWQNYGEDYLKEYGMKIYQEPNNKFAFEKWILICIIILILFLILLMILKIVLRYYSNTNKKRRSSDISIIQEVHRGSKISLTPHPHQVTPAFIEKDYSFSTYDPDDAISKNKYSSPIGHQNLSYVESDDDSDIDIYQHFSNSGHNNDNLGTNNKETDI